MLSEPIEHARYASIWLAQSPIGNEGIKIPDVHQSVLD